MNHSPIFRTLMFCASMIILGFAISTMEWFWVGVLAFMAVLDAIAVVKCVRSRVQRYRAMQTAAAVGTFAIVWCAGMAVWTFNTGEFWMGLVNITIMVLNIVVLFKNRRAFRRVKEVDLAIEKFKAHFTDEDSKLFEAKGR